MLILPPGHFDAVSGPRRRGGRERWIIASGIGVLAALAVVTAIALTSVQRRSGHGCIDVSAATVIGGSELYRCGGPARALCAAANPVRSRAANASFERALVRACRTAGLPVPG